jgi:hypothetical protein
MRYLAIVIVAAAGLVGCGDNESLVPADASVIDAGGAIADARADGPVSGLDSPIGADAAPSSDGPLAADAPLTGSPDSPEAADAAPAIDAAPPADALEIGDAGTSLTKSFSFTDDTDGFVQSFADEGMAMTWKNDDGEPAGALSFAAISAGTIKVLSPEFTWEDWGVPAGAQVVFVRLKSYKRRTAALSDMDHHWAIQIVGADNGSAHDGLDGAYLELTSLTHTIQTAWETVSDLKSYEVRPAYRASNTPLFIKVWYFPLLTGAIDWRLDELELEIVYITP